MRAREFFTKLAVVVGVASVTTLACEPSEKLPQLVGDSSPRATPVAEGSDCEDEDEDGDGFYPCGIGVIDCDDSDATITDECVRCATPQEGCPCEVDGAEVNCGERVSQIGNIVSCLHGTRECQDGSWGACSLEEYSEHEVETSGVRTLAQRQTPCDSACDPFCRSLEADPEPDADGDAIYDDEGNVTIIPEGGVGGTSENLCAGETAEALKTKLGLVMMLDSSGSMDFDTQDRECTGGWKSWCLFNCCKGWTYYPTRWGTVEQPLEDFVLGSDLAGMAVGLSFFPRYDERWWGDELLCDADDYDDLDVPITNWNKAGHPEALRTAIDTKQMDGGTPLLGALTGGIDAAKTWAAKNGGYTNNGREKKGVVILMTDGNPDGCSSDEQTKAATAAQTAFTSDGIETFVIGMQADGVDLSYLHQLAAAGSGNARSAAFIIDPAAGNASQQVADALNEIRGAIVSCEFDVPLPSQGVIDPAGTTLTITANGQPHEITMVDTVGDCHADGAYYDAMANEVLLCPGACDLARGDANSTISINYHCLANCTSQAAEAKPGPVDLFVMMDRSGSMHGDRWTSVRDAVSAFAHSSDVSDIGLGISYFPPANECARCQEEYCTQWGLIFCWNWETRLTTYPDCEDGAWGYDSNICSLVPAPGSYYWVGEAESCTAADYVQFGSVGGAVPIAPLTAAQQTLVDRSLNNVAPVGGTPTRPALQGAIDYLAGRSQQAAVILATDGEPKICDDLLRNDNVSEIAQIAATGRANGTSTYVIGVSDDAGVDNLNTIAQSGGGVPAFIVEDASAQNDFIQAMHEIRALVQSCTLEVPEPPVGQFSLDDTQVFRTDDQGRRTEFTRVADEAACGSIQGWYLEAQGAGDPLLIQLCPEACKTAQGSKGRTDVLFSCIAGTGAGSVVYTYDNESPDVLCPKGHQPIWGDWSWSASTPGQSKIYFDVATGDSLDDLSDWVPLTFTSELSSSARGATGDFRGQIACASQSNECNPAIGVATETGGPADWAAQIPHDVFVNQVLVEAGLESRRYAAIRVRLESDDQGNVPVFENSAYKAGANPGDPPESFGKPELRFTCEATQ